MLLVGGLRTWPSLQSLPSKYSALTVQDLPIGYVTCALSRWHQTELVGLLDFCLAVLSLVVSGGSLVSATYVAHGDNK